MRFYCCAGAKRQTGVTLIVAMILVVLIALTAAASMRSATSSEQVVNSLRLEALAQQYAEMALRFCETQLVMAPADRVPALRNFDTGAAASLANASWRRAVSWHPAGNAAIIPAAMVANAENSTFAPPMSPECLIDKVTLSTGNEALLVTARGFSPGYRAHATTGETLGGSVVWLQSTLAN